MVDVKCVKGNSTTDGRPTWDIVLNKVTAKTYTDYVPSEQDLKMFAAGASSEQERIWDKLADLIEDQELLGKITWDKLFG